MPSPNAPPDGGSDRSAGEFLDRAFFRSLVDNGSDAIVTIDEDSEVLYANRAVERVFGHSPEALVGEPLTTVMPERFRDDHRAAMTAYVRTGVRSLDWSGVQLPAQHASGEEIQIDITFEEHRHEGERVFSGIVRDVTDRVERTRRLERQTEQLEQFANVVSHDLRDPLQAAKAGLAVARARTGDEGVEGALTDVEAKLDRMNELVEDVLALAKQGRAIGETEPVDLRSVAESAWESVGSETAALAFADPPARVEADGERLVAMLENLLGNSVEHGATGNRAVPDDAVGHGARRASARDARRDAAEHGSTSSLSQAQEDSAERSSASSRTQSGDVAEVPSASNQRPEGADDAVEHGGPAVHIEVGGLDGRGFYVADDGPGFEDVDPGRLFEHGYTGSDDGTGFGLSIVEGIASAHGWTVTATESADGGARFEVTGVTCP